MWEEGERMGGREGGRGRWREGRRWMKQKVARAAATGQIVLRAKENLDLQRAALREGRRGDAGESGGGCEGRRVEWGAPLPGCAACARAWMQQPALLSRHGSDNQV